ncbi:hypothetical protein [Nocardia yamanashiensis]|uniref:hypothetical protein n=1 Tax=Nocardia yamanashiensis TaxID=209247 RepID=UPI00082AC703|nr:hypothetical protein [Nocardia yamanashiensis]
MMTESWRTWLPDHPDEIDRAGEDFEAEEFVDDDPLAAIKLDMRERVDAAAARRKLVRAGVIAAGVVGIAVAGTVAFMLPGRGDSQAAAPAPTKAAPASAAPPWCASSRGDSVVVGDGKGKAPGTPGVTGPDLILYQQWQWYVARNADAARSVLAPDAQAADPETARAAVAAVPQGTKHCVTITTLAKGAYDVQIEEKHPDGSKAHWQQRVSTAAPAGQLVITAITAGGEQ